ncbi:hypothetical protein ROHU_002717 [Labeo rohita]|nr:hypothetical protein ROHU_032823 [Labeo rohita]RXN22957.1 hypothetical protein ROHU_006548 [Labeo rohita]RXN36712.1 hypothetical protein ROHU_002717 [Labeo rohita]
MPQARLSFLIRAMYDTLPCHKNLNLWYGTEESCQLCSQQLQKRQQESPATSHGLIQLVRQGGEALRSSTKEQSLLPPGGNWELKADLDHQLKFPQQTAVTSLRPDVLLWSTTAKIVIMVELTVPWKVGLEVAFEWKKERYTDLSDTCKDAWWQAFTYPVVVGC